MGSEDTLDPAVDDGPAQFTLTPISISVEMEHDPPAGDGLPDAVEALSTKIILVCAPMEVEEQPARSVGWSPFRPLASAFRQYRQARQALKASGGMSIAYVCITVGLASVVWRHDTILIGIAGGVLVAGILLVRTGAYREYRAALQDAQGFPQLGVVLRYNVECLVHRIRALWRP